MIRRRRASRVALAAVLLACAFTALCASSARADYLPSAAPYATQDAPFTAYLANPDAVAGAGSPTIPGAYAGASTDAASLATKARMAGRFLPAFESLSTLGLYVGAFSVGWQIGTGINHAFHISGSIGTSPASGGSLPLAWSYSSSSACGANTIDGCSQALPYWILKDSANNTGFMTTADGGPFPDSTTANAAAAIATATGGHKFHFAAGSSWKLGLNPSEFAALLAITPESSSAYAGEAHTATSTYTPPTPTSGDRSAARTVLGAPVASRDAGGIYRDAAGNPLTVVQVIAQADANCRIDASYCPGGANDPARPGAPLADLAAAPNCAAMTFAACASAYIAAGFTGTITQTILDFDHADLTKPGDRVVTTSLAPGAFVPKTQPLTVTTNPADVDMPVELPAIDPGETSKHYRARLVALGLLAFFITEDTLSDGDYDPRVGPDGAVRVWPRPATRVHKGTAGAPDYDAATHPEGGTRVTVVANPSSAPDATTGTGTDTDPGAGGSGFTPPALPGIHLEPLSGLGAAACSSFPFGIPCYVIATVHNLVGASEAPHFSITLPHLRGSDHCDPAHPDLCAHDQAAKHLDVDLRADFAGVQVGDLMQFVRPLLLLMSFVGLAMWLARKGSNNDAADAD